jgi:DNA polymerase-3 subunit delta
VKLTAGQVERFMRAPDPRARAILVYGPDEGLVRERVERLIAGALDDVGDPFRLSELALDVVRSEPARLADEARALTLTGGRRVVRLRQASDQATPACRLLLAEQAADALVVIDAGDLGASSSLRRLMEQAANAAAIPCYRDQGRELGAQIDRLLAEHGLAVAPDARAYLVEHLGADRGVTRSELAKLALYADGAGPEGGRISLDLAATVIGDSAALGLDDLVDAVAAGEVAQAARCLDRLLGEGQAPVRVVRSLANHFARLHRFALLVERGEAAERVIEQARPPVHFRRKAAVGAALRRWRSRPAGRALARLLEAELACKRTGWPAELLCREVALDLCRAAAP